MLTTALAVNYLAWKSTRAMPQIEGVFIPTPQPVADFTLQNQYHQEFRNKDLQGQWNLLAYGFTHCPDFCPTLLTELTKVTEKLQQDRYFNDLQVIFYSIDPDRDDSEQLARYMAHFNADFIGLRRKTDTPTVQSTPNSTTITTNTATRVSANQTTTMKTPTELTAFEQSLGIVYRLAPLTDGAHQTGSESPQPDPSYSVAHGTMMYLINPAGELQAILRPQSSADGVPTFTAEQVYQDYLTVRLYTEKHTTPWFTSRH